MREEGEDRDEEDNIYSCSEGKKEASVCDRPIVTFGDVLEEDTCRRSIDGIDQEGCQ